MTDLRTMHSATHSVRHTARHTATQISSSIKVIAFDVFGTVADWHRSIAREVDAMKLAVDGNEFALAWRAGYRPAMEKVMSGELGWTRIGDLHRLILDE